MARYKSLRHAFIANSPQEKSPGMCWEWQGTIVGGYGMVKFRGKRYLAHRLSYELHKGPIPEAMHVCHSCDNPGCVNPAHLWLGTNADNHVDKIAKGRQGRVKGRKQPGAKLSYPKVCGILNYADEGLSQTEIARIYGVSQSTISHVINGKAWMHVRKKRKARL